MTDCTATARSFDDCTATRYTAHLDLIYQYMVHLNGMTAIWPEKWEKFPGWADHYAATARKTYSIGDDSDLL